MGLPRIATLLVAATLVTGCGRGNTQERRAESGVKTRLPATLHATNDLSYSIDNITETSGGIQVEGWAYITTLDARDSEVSVVLQAPDGTQDAFRAWKKPRRDVSEHFHNQNLDDSGFSAWIPRSTIAPGEYRVGILIRRQGREAVQYTSRMLRIDSH